MEESDEKWWELLIELYNLLINIEFFIKNSGKFTYTSNIFSTLYRVSY